MSTCEWIRGITGAKRFFSALLLTMFVSVSAFAMDYEDIKELIRHKVPEQSIINVVRQGVDFVLTGEQADELRYVGASEELIAALTLAGAELNNADAYAIGDGTGDFMTLGDLDPNSTVLSVPPASGDQDVIYDENGKAYYLDPATGVYYENPPYASPSYEPQPGIVIDSSPTIIYDSSYYDYSYPTYDSYNWGGFYWSNDRHRPRPPSRPPAHRPPPSRPGRPHGPPPAGRPPGGRPPAGRPPSGKPPGGRPPAGKPPGGRPPAGKPPGGRPPGGRPPGGKPPKIRPRNERGNPSRKGRPDGGVSRKQEKRAPRLERDNKAHARPRR